jgi:uncharacterized membrane protein
MDFTKFICHRKPERSFKYKNTYFPVCSRCTGFYLGMIVSIPIYFFFLKYLNNLQLIYPGLILLIPMALDGGTQALKYRESNNSLRFVTGLLGGFGVMLLIFNLILNGSI